MTGSRRSPPIASGVSTRSGRTSSATRARRPVRSIPRAPTAAARTWIFRFRATAGGPGALRGRHSPRRLARTTHRWWSIPPTAGRCTRPTCRTTSPVSTSPARPISGRAGAPCWSSHCPAGRTRTSWPCADRTSISSITRSRRSSYRSHMTVGRSGLPRTSSEALPIRSSASRCRAAEPWTRTATSTSPGMA